MKSYLVLAALALSLPGWGAEREHPNVVFLLADQWRARATGYSGDPNVKTPNLDRLRKEGLCFRSVVSVDPVCTPYRAALMTGKYPTSTGMFLNDICLPEKENCMAEIFGAAGYSTAYIGKWHLDGHGRDSYIPPERRQGWQYWKAAECDHNYNHSHYYSGNSDEKKFWPGYDAFAQTQDAQQYLRDHAKDSKPFLLMVAYGTPHFPHATAPPEYKEMYPVESIQLPPNVPEELRDKARKEAQGYYAHCTALDKCVGDIVTTLEQTGLSENTILVFTSDHGETLGSHGHPPFTKQVQWDESAHVPFLMRYPAISNSRGRTVDTPFTTPDILPTLLGLARIAVPKSIEGQDLSDVVRSRGPGPDRGALYMSVAPFVRGSTAREYRAMRTRRFTYVENLGGPWLMFDDLADPYQTNNLVQSAAFAAERKNLGAQLKRELARIGDDFRPASAYITDWGYEVSPGGEIPYGANAKRQAPKRKNKL